MNPVPRLLGLSIALLVVFLAAAGGSQLWLRGEDARLQAAAIETKTLQLNAVLALGEDARPAGADYARWLGGLLDADVILDDSGADPPVDTGRLQIGTTLPDGRRLTARFHGPVGARLLFLHQRVLVGMLLLGTILLAIPVAFVLLRGRGAEAGSRPPWGSARAEMESLHHLARASVAQEAELARVRDEQLRTLESAQLRQSLLDRALEEKVRLGRDLHDGLIQSLYATGLTLESARDLVSRDPDESARRIQTALEMINAGIRDVRGHITGLAPASLQRQGFADAVSAVVRELGAGREVEFDLRVDEVAAARLDQARFEQALLVVREAISNALRHGGARRITVRVHAGDGAVGILVQDDGSGFAPERLAGDGHGLGNMRARAGAIGGQLQLESAPGRGTRLVLTLPVVS